MSNRFNARTFGLIAVSIIIFSSIFFTIKNSRGPPAVLVPMNTDVGLERHLPKIHINPILNVAPPPFVPSIKEEPPNRIVGSVPVINKPFESGSRDDSALGESNVEGSNDDLEIPVPDHVDSKDLSLQLQEQKMVGRVNYDLWWNVVGYYVDDLRIYKYFPNHPDERKTLEQLHIDFHDDSPDSATGRYSHKVYGYFLPPKPGVYRFKFIMDKLTAAATVELWISLGPSPLDTRKCLLLEYDDLTRPTERKATTLNKEAEYKFTGTVHYFEYFMKAYEGMAIVDLLWKPPGHKEFVPIPSANMAMAVQVTSEGKVMKGEVARILQDPLQSSHLQTHHRAYYVGNIIYPISDFEVLPQCEFSAQYAYPHRVKAYTGVSQVKGSMVYPKDDTWFKNWHADDKGNPVIEQGKVDQVVRLYREALNKSAHKGQVSQLVNMEETVNKKDGSRFLLELVIELSNRRELINTSEYVYLQAGSDKLCHTSNFQWRGGVKVYLVVAVKNLSYWINHLMQNMEEIFAATKDDQFYLIVTDYGSEDANVEDLMSKSSFKNWHVISLTGSFSRSGGLQAAIDYVTDPDSIVMTIDMHLTLPTGFIEAIRRHTIQGKMGYTPYFFRLNKGFTEINYNGFWETLTYGMFGMFKSDWTTFGGFNLRKYKDKWGGEDWDILDRSLAKGYEVFRARVPGLVHYHHTKAGMWGGKAHD